MTAGKDGAPIAHARRTQSSILLTEKGWTAHRAENDGTHEWAYIQTVEAAGVADSHELAIIDLTVKAFQCMHCKLEKRANIEDATYITKQGVSHTCPPCPRTIAVPQTEEIIK